MLEGPFGGDFPSWHPLFQAGTSTFDIYNSSEYDPCAVCGLKGDVIEEKKEKNKEKFYPRRNKCI